MYRKRFSLLAVALVCVALALLGTPRLAEAAPPETVEMMFGLYIEYDSVNPPDPIPDPYYVGEDTLAILTGELGYPEYLRWYDSSPAVGEFDENPDGQIEVGGTYWEYRGPATILNIGGPTEALLYINSMPPWPPAHYPLLFDEITEVHTSWIAAWLVGGQRYLWVQEFFSPGETSGVFIVVKGKFRAKQ